MSTAAALFKNHLHVCLVNVEVVFSFYFMYANLLFKFSSKISNKTRL